jgi:hypothetical protein
MRRTTLKLAIAGAIAFLIGFLSTIRTAPAQEPQRFDLKVRQDFFAGFGGNREALTRGMQATETALSQNPRNAEAMVWHGGGLMFQAGEAFQGGDQPKGMDLWMRGMKEMQTAVDLEPDNVGVRIPRGATLLTFSRFLPDEQMAKPLIKDGVGDYERTYELQKAKFETLGTHPRGELLFGLAEGYSRMGEEASARTYFELIQKDLPGTVYAKRADAWMETKSLPAGQTGCVGCHSAK